METTTLYHPFSPSQNRNPGHKLYTRRRAAPSSRSSVSAAAMPSWEGSNKKHRWKLGIMGNHQGYGP